MPDTQPLAGKVAVVTGAGRGIGAAIAAGLAGAGATVCCAARTLAEIEATAARIGHGAFALPADVTDAASVEALYAQAAARAGGLDIVFINAGVSLDHAAVAESDPGLFERTLQVNLVGAYHCARLAIPHLRARGGGRMVLIGSGMGHNSLNAQAAYACSKAGVWMLVRVLANELRGDGISVNELIPGPVRTTMTAAKLDATGVIGSPVEWVKQPDDVVPLAMMLATYPAPGPTGQSFSLMRRTL